MKLYATVIIVVFLHIASFHFSDSARILGIIPSASYSHQIVFRPIWNELSNRGHEVIVITTDPERNVTSNVTEIDVSFVYDDWREFIRIVEENINPFSLVRYAKRFALDLCEKELTHPSVADLLGNDSQHFDLVMAELFFPVMFGLGHKFNCPVIGMASLDIPNKFYNIWGNPVHPIAYPDVFIAQRGGAMNFWNRLESVLYELFLQISHLQDCEWMVLERNFLQKHFGLSNMSMEDMMKDFVSMIFINVPPALSMRPLGPNVVNIGGNLHIRPPKKLSEELQTFLDGAVNGVVYCSLGTNVKSNLISPALRKVFLDTFRKLPQRVLWKFDITDLEDVPDNVKIMDWLPQQDILRHPNVKAFVFQGGFQSMEEAILNHIPIVGIPFISDQYANVKRIVENGYGIYLDKKVLTTESLTNAIKEIIENPIYKQNIKGIAELIRDQPMTGLEKAIWWTEYVLRHKGARHLRNPIVDLPFYQYYLLDVIMFLLIVSFLFVYIIVKLCLVAKSHLCLRREYNKLKRK